MSDWKPVAKDMGAWRPVEWEIGINGERTGRMRYRQFSPQYVKAAKTGLWASLEIRATWQVDFAPAPDGGKP